MSYSKEQIKKVVEEEYKRITQWLDDYHSMNPDITISQYEEDMIDLVHGILKRFGYIENVYGDM